MFVFCLKKTLLTQTARAVALLFFSWLCISSSYAQLPTQMFQVTGLPANAGYSLEKLNREISTFTTKKEVLRLIRSRKQLLNVPVEIMVTNGNGTFGWWHLNPGRVEKQGDFTVFQSKATDAGRFYKRREVQVYFRDTIVVFDTLKMGMYLQDADFRIEGYFLKLKGIGFRLAIPYERNNNLLITDSLFSMQPFAEATLYNTEDTSEAVTNMTLYFPDEDTKASIRAMAKSLREALPDADNKEIAGYISGYIKSNYGTVSFKELINFLFVKPE